MAINKIRQLSDRSIPKLKDKVEFTDIVNDSVTGGTQKPVSAEAVKVVRDDLSQEIADRGQAVIDLKGGVSITNDTLGKIETNLNQEITDRGNAITQEVSDRNAAILAEENRAKAAESALAGDITALSTSAANSTDAEESRAKGEEARIESKLDGEIAITDAEIALLNNDDTTAGSVAYAVKQENTRAISEEGRIEGKLDQEILDRTAGDTAVEAYADAAVLVEKTRAEGAEGTLDSKIDTEKNRALAAEGVNAADITTLAGTVSGNKSAIEASLSQEVADRLAGDSALSGRLTAVEGTLVAGVSWKGSVADLAGIDALVESDIIAGQAYYVTAEKDVYVVLPDQGGDYVPAGFTTKSFLKIADFAELSGLVTAEKNRAEAAEQANASAITAEANTRGSEITRVEGLVSTEKGRAEAAELVNANAIIQLDTDYKAADTAMTAAYQAADTVVDNRITSEVSTLNSTITSNKTATDAAIAAETSRATGVEAGLQSNIDTLNDADTVAGSVAYAVKAEETRALAAEGVIAGNLSQEITDRTDDVDAEEARALAAEGVIDGKVDTEIADRQSEITRIEGVISANKSAFDGRVDILEGDKNTVGSVAAAEYNAKVYFDTYAPQAKIEGIIAPISVINDTVTLTYAPMIDGVINGEVVVYHADNAGNLEAVAVNVLSVSGSIVTLDVTSAGEFDGDNVKVNYFFREADQSGAGMGVAGSGGAGI